MNNLYFFGNDKHIRLSKIIDMRKVNVMGRKKKEIPTLQLDSVQIVYKPEFKKEWLNLCADWVEQEVRKKIREAELDI